MQWYFVENQRSVGPLEEDVFLGFVRSGRVTPHTLVWHEGMAEWTRHGALQPPAPPGAPPVKVATGFCVQCRRPFRRDEMLEFQGSTVCAECKPAFFQALQEGVASSATGGVGGTPNSELMAIARLRLDGRWGTAIGVSVLFGIITFVVEMFSQSFLMIIGLPMQVFLRAPFVLGKAGFFLAVARKLPGSVGMISEGFNRYWISVGAHFFRGLIVHGISIASAIPAIALAIYATSARNESTLFWVLFILFLIPPFFLSIYLELAFSLTFYLVADEANTDLFSAITRSFRMMRGMKWKLFCLHLRFLGWGLPSLLILVGGGIMLAHDMMAGGGLAITIGLLSLVGLLWLAPYYWTSLALFYDDIRGRARERQA